MILSPYTDELRFKHQFQHNSNDCGPFCAAMTLSFSKKVILTGDELGRKMNKLRWRGIIPVVRRIPNWATFPWGIVDVFREQHITAKWLIFQRFEKVIDRITASEVIFVIIGDYRPMWSHYKILLAYDEEKGLGFLDPAFPTNEITWNSVEYFKAHWKKFGCQIILVKP